MPHEMGIGNREYLTLLGRQYEKRQPLAAFFHFLFTPYIRIRSTNVIPDCVPDGGAYAMPWLRSAGYALW